MDCFASAAIRALCAWMLTGLLLGCGSSPPNRNSPRLDREAFPEGRSLALGDGTNSIHTGWLYRVGTPALLEFYDDAGLITTTPEGDATAFDMAPDRSVVLCGAKDVRVYDGSGWSVIPLSKLTPDGALYHCTSVAERGKNDVWVALAPNAGAQIMGSVPPHLFCRLGAACLDIGSITVWNLVLTAGHAWWLSRGRLVVFDTAVPASTPKILDPSTTADSLHPSRSSESVLANFPAAEGVAPPKQLISIDGSRTLFQSPAAEAWPSEDAWLTADDRVLAVERLSGGSCTSGFPFGYAAGRSCHTDWVQLVLYQLTSGAPIELGYGDPPPSQSWALHAVQRSSGNYISSGDSFWFREP